MRPEDIRLSNAHIVVPTRQSSVNVDSRNNNSAEAANIIRGKIESIYQNDPNTTANQPVEQKPVGAVEYTPPPKTASTNLQYDYQDQEVSSPYERTHNEQKHQIQPSTWQRYHSAWQSYYQQYYERYYLSQVHEAKRNLEDQVAHREQVEQEVISTDEALYDLRAKLRSKVEERTKKIRKSRHFIPTIAALSVMIVFLFLQYNRVLFASVEAYIAPATAEPSNIVIDPSLASNVGPEPRLIVPKINVDVPIVWDAVAADQNSLNNAMDHGVAWFNIVGANAKPGEKGNFVVSGHSSNDWLDNGNYKFIFARLEQIKEGDIIYANFNGTRYTYNVTGTKVVKPTDVTALHLGDDKPYITLVTCTPLGTAINRLLVFGEQISPNPNTAVATQTSSAPSNSATQMPSNSPTFLQRLFGGGN